MERYTNAVGGGSNPFAGAVVNPQTLGAESSAIDSIARRLESICKSALMLDDRLERVAARAFGEGTQGTDKGPRPVRGGLIGTINDHLDDIESILDRASSRMNRVDEII